MPIQTACAQKKKQFKNQVKKKLLRCSPKNENYTESKMYVYKLNIFFFTVNLV